MNTYYGNVFSTYWTGATGRQIREQGGKDAQLLGLFLLSNPYMNMLGLYRLKLRDVEDDCGLTVAESTQAFSVLEAADFALYDAPTQFVWVRSMARVRLNISDEPLKVSDHRLKGAQKLWDTLQVNPFLGQFHNRYGELLGLRRPRGDVSSGAEDPGTAPLARPVSLPLNGDDDAPARQENLHGLVGMTPDRSAKPLQSPFEAPSKGLRSQNQNQDQNQKKLKSSGCATAIAATKKRRRAAKHWGDHESRARSH